MKGSDRPEDSARTPHGGSVEWYRRGLGLLNSGSPAAAVQVLSRAAAAEPDSRSIREALARALFDTGEYEAAADSFRRIVDANPSEDYAQFGLGLSLVRSGDAGGGVGHLALAVAMCPDNAHYKTALRNARARVG